MSLFELYLRENDFDLLKLFQNIQENFKIILKKSTESPFDFYREYQENLKEFQIFKNRNKLLKLKKMGMSSTNALRRFLKQLGVSF